MKKVWLISSIAFVVLAGTGTVLYLRKKKKNESEDSGEYSDGGSTATTAKADPRVYKGITDTQTLALQKLINKFYSSGSLSGMFDNIWDAGKKLFTTTAKSVVSTITNGAVGLTEFKAAVASIMPLKEDGIYGKNTLAAVKALQTYLNANGANLTVDGKYGKNTDSATGWGVMSLAGFIMGLEGKGKRKGKRKGKGKGKGKRKASGRVVKKTKATPIEVAESQIEPIEVAETQIEPIEVEETQIEPIETVSGIL